MGAQTQGPKKKLYRARVYSQTRRQLVTLPKGLIGAKCTAQVTIGDKECSCLLDSGSQVTTIPNTFYLQNLSHSPLNSLNDLLEVEGANQGVKVFLTMAMLRPTSDSQRACLGWTLKCPRWFWVYAYMPTLSTLLSVLIGTNTLDVFL